MGFDDLSGGWQPQAGASGLGGVEGVEGAVDGGRFHAAAGIDQIERHAAGGTSRPHDQLPAVGHGLLSVDNEVQQSGSECFRIDEHAGQIGVEVALDFDLAGFGLGFEQVQHGGDLVIKIVGHQVQVA